jgi:phosphoribosylglycinamide formyltransferase-1
MEAILQANLPLVVRAVISNRPDARGLQTAAAAGISTTIVDHKVFTTRQDFDAALMAAIDYHAPDFVVLAGFMRVLTAGFIDHYPRRIVNIHPSLLPSFPGLHTHRQALAAGVKIHGATVHLVTPQLDHGPIIAQAAVPVMPDDDEARLAARVLRQEHRLYPQVLRWLAEDRVRVDDGGVVHLDGLRVEESYEGHSIFSPDANR